MALKKIKVGKVTFSNPASGAFIQVLPEEGALQMQSVTSITSQVFVPPDFLAKMGKPLEVGQLVRFEVAEDETVASKVEPLG